MAYQMVLICLSNSVSTLRLLYIYIYILFLYCAQPYFSKQFMFFHFILVFLIKTIMYFFGFWFICVLETSPD